MSDNDYPCEGCEHFVWDKDMNASYPYCQLKKKYEPIKDSCFVPSRLYMKVLEWLESEVRDD